MKNILTRCGPSRERIPCLLTPNTKLCYVAQFSDNDLYLEPVPRNSDKRCLIVRLNVPLISLHLDKDLMAGFQILSSLTFSQCNAALVAWEISFDRFC